MLTLLARLELTPFSVWVRESPSLFAFPFILYLHTLGLAMLAGINVGLDVWLLARKSAPSFDLTSIYRVMWLGFGINLLSGLALLAAYPAKALTNWVFFAKLTAVVLGVYVLQQLKGELAQTGAYLQRLQTEEAQLMRDIATEQDRWAEINRTLEELDRALIRR